MIHINLEGKEPPAAWVARAKAATCKLNKITDPDERAKFIKKNDEIWSDPELKDWLRKLSHDKCWYSDHEIYSFYDVDHFRPKNRAKQLDGTERGGYWWLAFDWHNYRLSGGIGNRPNKDPEGGVRGKGDFFPLRDSIYAATGPDFDLRDESANAYLLDPTDADDVNLLSFDETGQPVALAPKGSWRAERVRVTVEKLHLDYRPLVEERKKVWLKCRKLIEKGEELLRKHSNAWGPSRDAELKEINRNLRAMVAPQAELSATARECLRKSGYEWAERLASG